MQPEELNLPAAALAAATPGRWTVPRQCEPVDMWAPRDWRVLDSSGTWTICRIPSADAPSPDVARANAFVVSAARDTLQLVLDIARASYTTSSTDLIDRSRAVLRELDERFRDAQGEWAAAAVDSKLPADAAALPLPDSAPGSPGGGPDDTLVIYLDAQRRVQQHRCRRGEAERFTARLPHTGLRSFLFFSEHPFGIETALQIAPDLAAPVREAVARLRRDAAALDAMDRHDVPADPVLRAKVLQLVDDLTGAA